MVCSPDGCQRHQFARHYIIPKTEYPRSHRNKFYCNSNCVTGKHNSCDEISKGAKMAPSSEKDSAATPNTSSNGTFIISDLYDLRAVPGRGKGLIATQPIAAGTQIISEAPLFTTESLTSLATQERDLAVLVRALPKESQRALLLLHNNNPGSEPFSNIVRSNAYPLGPSSNIGAIFPTVARINHSCLPNAQHAWNTTLKQETVYAIRDINKDDEITLSYSTGGASKERRETLKKYFGFDCSCELCSLPAEQLKENDAKQRRAQQLDEAIGNPKQVMMRPEKALTDCRDLLAIYKGDGVGDTRIPRLYFDAFQICGMHSDQARARVFAQRSREARILCEGAQSPEAAECGVCE